MRLTGLRLAAALALLATTVGAQQATNEKPRDFLADMLARISLGDPMQSGPLVLVPLVIDEAPPLPNVAHGLASSKLTIREPAWPERRFNVEISNETDQPLLLLGGTIFVGGKLDRMVPRDLLVAAGETLEVNMLPAEYQRRYRRKEPPPFRPHTTLAPDYLRDRAMANPYRNLVPDFISHFLEFRREDDDRLSLAAIDGAPALAKYCISCQAGLAEFPDIAQQRVVGFITAVRGRIHNAEIFGHNTLLKAYFDPLIRAHTYAAAAIELRAERIGFPLPKDQADALAKARENARSLLDKLKTKARTRRGAVEPGSVGQKLLLKAGGTDGYALGLDGRLVHAVVFPYDPLERRLYSRPLSPPDEGEREDPDVGELERREEGGRRLTEYERRLLDRIRRRR